MKSRYGVVLIALIYVGGGCSFIPTQEKNVFEFDRFRTQCQENGNLQMIQLNVGNKEVLVCRGITGEPTYYFCLGSDVWQQTDNGDVESAKYECSDWQNTSMGNTYETRKIT